MSNLAALGDDLASLPIVDVQLWHKKVTDRLGYLASRGEGAKAEINQLKPHQMALRAELQKRKGAAKASHASASASIKANCKAMKELAEGIEHAVGAQEAAINVVSDPGASGDPEDDMKAMEAADAEEGEEAEEEEEDAEEGEEEEEEEEGEPGTVAELVRSFQKFTETRLQSDAGLAGTVSRAAKAGMDERKYLRKAWQALMSFESAVDAVELEYVADLGVSRSASST